MKNNKYKQLFSKIQLLTQLCLQTDHLIADTEIAISKSSIFEHFKFYSKKDGFITKGELYRAEVEN